MMIRSMTLSLFGLALMAAPVFAAQPARPGTINYIEGAASIDGQPINPKDVGNVGLNVGDELTTGKGKAEILLTPGVFLRVDDNTAVKMVSPDIVNTQIEIDKGHAGVEVDEIHDENNLQVLDAGVTTRLQKTGYYEFNADQPEVMVLKGKADVKLANEKGEEVKGHHELALAGADGNAAVKPAKFDETPAQDELMAWSRLRSQYLAEANNQIAGEYGYGYAPGWAWDPYGFYTYVGAGPFYSPFGWGFYPFGWGGYYGGGWYGRGYYGHGYYRGGYAHVGGYGGGMGGFHGGMGGGRWR